MLRPEPKFFNSHTGLCEKEDFNLDRFMVKIKI